MTALAGLLHRSGCRVTGSDGRLYPPTSLILESLGLELFEGFDASRLKPEPDLVVVGNAISRGNPEAEEVLDRGLNYTSMPRLVSERFLSHRHSIVVTGTHGKTTTTCMLAWILTHAGRDPGYLIGGLPLNLDQPFGLGKGEAFVIEGDEYDTAFFDKGPKFMHYRPDTAILGTVEFDHADIYRDLEQVKQVFGRLNALVPRRGLLIRNEDCAITRDITTKVHSRIEGFGIQSGGWRAAEIEYIASGSRFLVLHDEQPFATIELDGGGEHNIRNALAATAAAHEQGVPARAIESALCAFRGVRRRLELRGEVDGVAVLDDFAHHPTAVEETLVSLRRRYPDRKIWAVLEPRSWSLRRNVFQQRLVEVFDAADRVILAPVFRAEDVPAEERLDVERLVAELSARGRAARLLDSPAAIARHLVDATDPGDLVVVMSNGGFEGLHRSLLDGLESRIAPGAERA
jgi:UDP-N-acetylmuramate: L-alanyl-gamma-D-glutamyl-meso-diaminopimelate ligase